MKASVSPLQLLSLYNPGQKIEKTMPFNIPKLSLGCAFKPANCFCKPQIFNNDVMPDLILVYHLAILDIDCNEPGVSLLSVACSGGIDATGTWSHDVFSVSNRDAFRRAASGAAFHTGGSEGGMKTVGFAC